MTKSMVVDQNQLSTLCPQGLCSGFEAVDGGHNSTSASWPFSARRAGDKDVFAKRDLDPRAETNNQLVYLRRKSSRETSEKEAMIDEESEITAVDVKFGHQTLFNGDNRDIGRLYRWQQPGHHKL